MKKVNQKLILTIILISYFMILLDNSIIFTGTVKIAASLQLSPTNLSWVSNAYSLTFGGLLLLGGRLGDVFGRKRIFAVGLIIFGMGSLCVGLANSALTIILARAFQGIGSAILAPTTLALLMDHFTGVARTKAIAAYGATAGIGASLGLVIGGLFASLLSWRVGFFINVPIALVMLVLTLKFVPAQPTTQAPTLDFRGALTSILGMTALVYSLVGAQYRLGALLVALGMLALFIRHEATTDNPMMPLHLFKDRERLGGYLARFFYLGAMLTMWFLTPQVMQTQLGFSPLTAGLGFFPLTLINFVVALQVAKMTTRFGNTRLLIVGISVTILGMASLGCFNLKTGYGLGIALPMILMGIGQGLTLSPLTVAGVAHTNSADAGAASGVVNMVHQIGGSIGLSLLVAIASQFKQQLISYRIAMWGATSLLVLALIAVLGLILPTTRKGGGILS